ncbi:hypothetical protein [Acidicapsa ligni]|uniref:hypothetical protein n=1 Tax=Acidicapsa ligni TaxID=542300 RepID=UPI0021DFBEE4|nr:hypothetical protein [Acidicapsa ligni]
MSQFTLLRKRLLSPIGLHAVAFGVLAIATIFLGIRVGLDWHATSASNMDIMAGRAAQLRAMQIQTAPLRGLDKRVGLSRSQIDDFYKKRVPPSYSSILEQIGAIQAKSQVHLGAAQYSQVPGSGDLTEIRVDAGLSGDYPAIMHFVNGLERSETFFVIRTMALTGQQSGTVNLRLGFSTWLRPADAAVSGLPIEGAPKATEGTASDAAPSGEGR